MKRFMDDDFCLENEPAQRLYHDYASGMPIFDYHCHVPPAQIAENTRFENLTRLWLGHDHYKWRAMRTNGIDEKYITGDAPDAEKFRAWAGTVPRTIGNPLYHWTHLELKRVFGVDALLGPDTADEIYSTCNARLQVDGFRVHGLLRRFKVSGVCTTDDPVDSLSHHAAIAANPPSGTKVFPTFRPDKAHAMENPVRYREWVDQLSRASGIAIKDYDSLLAALRDRHAYFHTNGCRLSDHGLTFVPAVAGSRDECNAIVTGVLSGGQAPMNDILKLRGALLVEFGRMDAQAGWVMQLHVGALRNANTRMFGNLGPDTGFDIIGDWPQVDGMSMLLDTLDREGLLPKTILYVLNPRDNEAMGTMIGAFQHGSTPGKIQFGSGWWFNDQKDGMERHLTALSSLGLLSTFVGMLTDSRSFLSYPRHEYFRRILCNLIGGWVDRGEAPDDMKLLGGMVQDISYRNAATWFGVELPA